MTLRELSRDFKIANQRVDKSISRYGRFLKSIYFPFSYNDDHSGYSVAYATCFSGNGSIRTYATECSYVLYRRGRNGDFYEKPITDSENVCVWDSYRKKYQTIGQDYLEARKLEDDIDAAVDERERLLHELEKAGVNPYAKAKLWCRYL